MNEFEYPSETEETASVPETEPIPAPVPEAPPVQKKRGRAGFLAAALGFSLLGSALGAGGVLLAEHLTNNAEPVTSTDSSNVSYLLQAQRESTRLETVAIKTGELMTAAEVYAANVGSTVGITTSITTNYWGYTTTSAASGSGFIITGDGYILTNYHVIEDASAITVSLYDGGSYEATLIGYDESNDIAVLKIEAEGLSPVILGDSDDLNVGDSVVAIGNPLGELTFSLTAGTISAKDREVTMESNVTMNLMQTDCAINSGNSGGALFNMYGEVIGITNAKYSSSSSGEAEIDNIGFAIPINSIMDIVESIIEKGYIAKPYIGITVSDVSTQSQMFGVPAGAAVQAISSGSPAEEAGLQYGDVITAVNGTEITGSSGLKELVGNAQIGDIFTLTVYRQGETLEMTLTVGEQIQSALANEESQQSQQSSQSSQGGFPGWGGGRP